MAKRTLPEISTKDARQVLKGMVRTKYDIQGLRISTCNRLEKRKDGSDQDKPEEQQAVLDVKTIPDIVDTLDEIKRVENDIDKRIESYLKLFPIYNDFLKGVKGCGPAMSAVIISEFDIEKATTVSKMWQFAGLNPGEVFGKKKVDGETVTTTELVRGDRATPGFIIPYNKFLRTRLLGVLADCMIKSRSPFTKYYYDEKQKLSNSRNCYRGNSERVWCSETKAHIDRAAKRKMVKEFIRALYYAWRTMEGLPVRIPYEEEYLGHKTSIVLPDVSIVEDVEIEEDFDDIEG